MEHVQIQTTQHVGIDFEVAGLGDRAIAALIDYAVIGAYGLFVLLLNAATLESLAVAIVLLLPSFFYHLVCEVAFDGQSLGKWMRGIRVARLDGRQVRLGDYVLRWLLRLVELDLTYGVVATVTVLVNGKGQRLGDLAAGTTVVRVRRRLSLRDTLFASTDPDHVPTFPAVEHLDRATVATAKQVLDTLRREPRSRTTYLLGERTKAALEARLDVRSDLSPHDFLQAVVQDYNHLRGGV